MSRPSDAAYLPKREPGAFGPRTSMRISGSTWDEIAAALGVTRQTAYARYGSLIRYERRAADRTPE